MGIFQSIWEDAFMKEFTWEKILQFLIRMAWGRMLKISWKKDAKAAGYKVIYSTDKKFKNKKVTKTVTIKKNKTVSKTIKKLKKGKKYYVKVCSYAKIGKKEVLGSYSKVKSVKIKK